jgi:hypothetical protein
MYRIRAEMRGANQQVFSTSQPLAMFGPKRTCRINPFPGSISGEMLKMSHGKSFFPQDSILDFFTNPCLTTGDTFDEFLYAYDLPMLPDMHTFEKKRIVMQFLGLNENLMHKILD